MPHRRIRPDVLRPVAAKRAGPPASTGAVLSLPQVITLGANGITNTQASLTGSVNPNGQATNAWFAWGTTPQYGSTTPTLSMGSGSAPKVTTAVLTGLSVGTTYHFAAVAQSAAGTVYGQDLTFVAATVVVPSAIVTTTVGDAVPLIPHMAYPFTFAATTGTGVNEQDSTADVFACVQAIVACPVGARLDTPTFGVPNPLFSQAPIDVTAIQRAISNWEPRADTVGEEYPDLMSDAIRNVQISVSNVQTNQTG